MSVQSAVLQKGGMITIYLFSLCLAVMFLMPYADGQSAQSQANACSSKETCSQCIQTSGCAWCSETVGFTSLLNYDFDHRRLCTFCIIVFRSAMIQRSSHAVILHIFTTNSTRRKPNVTRLSCIIPLMSIEQSSILISAKAQRIKTPFR